MARRALWTSHKIHRRWLRIGDKQRSKFINLEPSVGMQRTNVRKLQRKFREDYENEIEEGRQQG